jgi:Fur family ferric uptake transcriptional regulator
MALRIEKLCKDKGLKMTGQRQVIAKVVSESDDHPDVEQIYARATKIDPKISVATVYRTMRLFEDFGIIEKLDFKDGRARYEESSMDHHHHLIDIRTGRVIEFKNQELEEIKIKIAKDLGYDLVDHTLELYGVKHEK